LRTNGIRGVLSTREAVEQLLQGTTLQLRTDESTGAMMIESAVPRRSGVADRPADSSSHAAEVESPDMVVVTVYGRSDRDTVREVPQSVRVFDEKFLQMTNIDTVGDVLRFVPTAARNASDMTVFGDSFTIRGFDASSTLNGIGFNNFAQQRGTINVERVEVLMGPASVLYGAMEPGAVVNIVTKKPLAQFRAETSAEIASYGSQRYTLDVTGPLTDSVRARLTGEVRDTQTYVNHYREKSYVVSPVVAFDLTDRTELLIEGVLGRSTRPNGAYYGVPSQGTLLPNPLMGPLPMSFNPGEPGGFPARSYRESEDINARLTHSFANDWQVRLAYNYTRNTYHDADVLAFGFAADGRTLRRGLFAYNFLETDGEKDNINDAHIDVSGEVRTGPVVHKLVFGAERRESRFRGNAAFLGIGAIDAYAPVYGTVVLNATPANFAAGQGVTESTINALFVQDRMQLGDKLNLILGVRRSELKETAVYSDTSKLTDSAWVPQLGALYALTDRISLFASRNESFVPQGGSSFGNVPFPAETGLQYELGSRFDLGGSGLSATAALFQIEKDNISTADPSHPGESIAIGSVRSRGVELGLQGYLLPQWSLQASYAHMKTEVTKNNDGLLGNELPNSPHDTVSLASRYDFTQTALRDLGLSMAVSYAGERFSDQGNSVLIPSSWRADLGAHYAFNDALNLDLLVNNVTDERIYTGLYFLGLVTREPGRTYLARLTLRM
ncbi:TonB-dependent siderophore receptor, partial [Steroidobacter sp.]|uniref:TonB-dependent siderophore receptor n=1 Tax=Steroidobacter sp. TaxID=1978227 RepID=UPI001A4C8942